MRFMRPLALIALLAVLGFGALTAYAATGSVQSFMNGANEVPGPGDPDGTGYAFFSIDTRNGTICYRLYANNIAPATAAHIHRGAAGVAGPVVVGLTPPTNGSAFACTTVSTALAAEILNNPAGFYVNVHNQPFPPGAVRGQLQP